MDKKERSRCAPEKGNDILMKEHVGSMAEGNEAAQYFENFPARDKAFK